MKLFNLVFLRISTLFCVGLSVILLKASSILSAYRANDNCRVIIGYLPYRQRGWILEYLFRDLAKRAPDCCRFILCGNPVSVALSLLSSKNSEVLAMHQSFVKELLWSGVSPDNLSSLYTHSRINSSINSSLIRKIAKWLPMNSSEANALIMAGASAEKVQIFRVGYESSIFNCESVNLIGQCRDIDILFVGRFEKNKVSHYYARKNYDLVFDVVKSLISSGYNVAMLGKGWLNLFDSHHSRPTFFDIPYSQTPAVYLRSKLVLSLSLLEGGPVSWLEAMACGCITVSTPTGFALDFAEDRLGSYLLSPRPSVGDVMLTVRRILAKYDGMDMMNINQARKEILCQSTFDSLAKNLCLVN